MKKKMLCSALLLCAGMLTGCGKKTDLSKRFPDYMAYCFGRDYHWQFEDTDSAGEECWLLTYQDENGVQQQMSRYFSKLIPYDAAHTYFKSADEYYDWMMYDTVSLELSERCSDAFRKELISPVFPVIVGGTETDGGKCHVFLSYETVYSELDAEPEDFPLLREKITPDTGWQVCAPDWIAASCDEQLFTSLELQLSEKTEPAPYIEKMKQIYGSFLDKTGNPQNYTFKVVQQTDKQPYRILWRADAILGQTVQMDTLLTEYPDLFTYSDLVLKRLREKHGITVKG